MRSLLAAILSLFLCSRGAPCGRVARATRPILPSRSRIPARTSVSVPRRHHQG